MHMKKVFYLTLILISKFSFAQIKEIKISKPYKITEADLFSGNGPYLKSINDSFVYILTERDESKAFNIKPVKYLWEKYDAHTLEKIAEEKVPFFFNYLFGDTVAYSQTAVEGKRGWCIGKYDFRTKDSMTTDPLLKDYSKGIIYLSPDSSCFIVVDYNRNTDGAIDVSYKMIGLDLKPKMERNFTIPFFVKKRMEENLFLNQFYSDKDSNLYFSLRVKNPKERGYNSLFNYEVVKYSYTDGKLTRYDVDLGSEYYSDCAYFRTDNESQKLKIYGSYSLNYGKWIGGLYLMEFDMQSGKRTDYKTQGFTQELIDQVKETQVVKKKDREIFDLGCPQRFSSSIRSEGYLFSFDLLAAYDEMGMILLSLDEKGNTEWSSWLHFEQKISHLSRRQVHGEFSKSENNHVYYFYNDKTTKQRNPQYQKYAKSKILETHISFVSKINIENGKSVTYPLLPLAELGFNILVRTPRAYSDKVVYAIAAKKHDHVLVKIIFE